MTLSLSDWHQRFQQQAGWTAPLRAYIYQHIGLVNARRVLEVGSGTGVLLEELARLSKANLFGVDLDAERLTFSKSIVPSALLIQTDACQLPFPNGAFDLVICHFLLLWVDDPLKAVQEMARVTQPGGTVAALAEPDYGGRIDYPPELEILGVTQRQALHDQGADPWIGRKISGLFTTAGIQHLESGVMGAQWMQTFSDQDFDLEWAVLRSDLQESYTPQQITALQAIDYQSRLQGTRVLYVPTFYTWGKSNG